MAVTRTRLFMLTVFLIFFLANSYSGEVRAMMWPIKFAALGLFLVYLTFGSRNKFRYQSRYTPGYVYYLLLLFAIFGLFSIYTYDGVFIHFISFKATYGVMLLIGLMIVTLFSAQLSRFLSVHENQSDFYFALVHGAAIVTYSNLVLYMLGINLGRGAGELGGAGGIGRFSGWLDNPNTLGVILLGAFPVALQAALNSRKKRRWMSYEGVLVLSMVLLMLLTGSRAGLLGMAVMGAMILWSHSRKARSLAFLLVMLGAVIFWLELSDAGSVINLAQFQRQGEDVISGRSYVWELGVHIFKESPLFGYGMGTEGALIEALKPVNSVHQGNNFHNSYLSLLIGNGVIGAIPLFILLLVSVKNSMRVFSSKGGRSDPFTVLMSTLFIGFLLHAFFESWLFSPGSVYGFLFWVACFWLLSGKRERVRSSERGSHRLSLESRYNKPYAPQSLK